MLSRKLIKKVNSQYQAWVMPPTAFFVCLAHTVYLLCGVIGNICQSGSFGLPHSAGRAHFLWGTVVHSHNDGKG